MGSWFPSSNNRSFPLSSKSRPARVICRWRLFLRPKGAHRIGVFSTALILSSLFIYITCLSPHPLSLSTDWNVPSHLDTDPLVLVDPNPVSWLAEPTPVLEEPHPPSPSPSPVSDVLTLEQIRDIVASTRGFFSRDYSLGLGWNNVSVILLALHISYN